MAINFRHLFLGLILFLFIQSLSAQYVSIPDSNFKNYLQANYPSCMNGNLMDTTCTVINPTTGLTIASTTSLSIPGLGIRDLTGIKYFNALSSLDCQNNLLTTLPLLPKSLTHLTCAGNQITSLPDLPNLTVLYCDKNQLQNLPTLPNSLILLSCTENQLTNLPALPISLTTLYCNNNQLAALPNLPLSLLYLYCNNNQLTQLPSLPAYLTYLYSHENLLMTLPELNDSLTLLYCGYNQLTTLPSLPNSLGVFDCSNNLLSMLPALPASLKVFNCSYNSLTTLPYLPNLTYLYCQHNHITCLPWLPYSLMSLEASLNPINCVPNYPNGYTLIPYIYPICSPSINASCTHYPIVEGNVFIDLNANGIKDNGEVAPADTKIEIQPSNIILGVDSNSFYSTTLDTGTYTIQFYNPTNYIATPSSYILHITGYGQQLIRDFALQPVIQTEIFNRSDIGIQIYPNPTNGILTIESPSEKIITLNLSTADGLLLKELTNNNLSTFIQFNLSDLPKGLYIIKLIGNETILNQKIILEK